MISAGDLQALRCRKMRFAKL